MKKLLLRLYYFGNSGKEQFNQRQKVIRDTEWEAIKPFIPKGAKFLDVGCGTGYSMKRAMEELHCDCEGIDPVPNYAGVRWKTAKESKSPKLKRKICLFPTTGLM